MKIDIKSRKGALTQQQIVMYLVLIAGFLVLLFFIFVLDLGAITNKEICRNSVILRDKATSIAGELDCRTNYLCISGGEDCEGITATTEVKVDSESKEEIMKALAEEMSDCWYMFGEDKELDYTGGPVSTRVECAICSIVKFDEKVQGKFPTITYLEFYEYLEKTKKDDFQSYLRYLYGVTDTDSLEIQDQFKIIDIKNDIISTGGKYSIITGIDNNLFDSFDDDEWLKVYIIPTEETSATSCKDFITKA